PNDASSTPSMNPSARAMPVTSSCGLVVRVAAQTVPAPNRTTRNVPRSSVAYIRGVACMVPPSMGLHSTAWAVRSQAASRAAAQDPLGELDVRDQAGVLVLLQGAAAAGPALAVPVAPEAVGQQLDADRPQPPALPLGGILDVQRRQRLLQTLSEDS